MCFSGKRRKVRYGTWIGAQATVANLCWVYSRVCWPLWLLMLSLCRCINDDAMTCLRYREQQWSRESDCLGPAGGDARIIKRVVDGHRDGGMARSELRASRNKQKQTTLCLKKTHQLWNRIAQNYKDRFWWYLAEIFIIIQNRVGMFHFLCRFALFVNFSSFKLDPKNNANFDAVLSKRANFDEVKFFYKTYLYAHNIWHT